MKQKKRKGWEQPSGAGTYWETTSYETALWSRKQSNSNKGHLCVACLVQHCSTAHKYTYWMKSCNKIFNAQRSTNGNKQSVRYKPETHPEWSTLLLWLWDLHLARVLLSGEEVICLNHLCNVPTHLMQVSPACATGRTKSYELLLVMNLILYYFN